MITLSRAEIASIIDYVFLHSRCNKQGKAWQVYKKLEKELNNETTTMETSRQPRDTESTNKPDRTKPIENQ